jgi:ABC-type nickel/cobalt efflux system permease component RcnA
MTAELLILCASAAGIAFVHTLLGPDHYLPFVALGRARRWSTRRTLGITLACGLGHIVGSLLLGTAGILLGLQLESLTFLEGVRGDLAAWGLVAFGLVYLSWGLRRGWRGKTHSHWHRHGAELHCHEHSHRAEHSHVHTADDAVKPGDQRSLSAWTVFIIFVVGPCEPLIPVLMYPAARESFVGVFAVAGIYSLVTVATMLLAVAGTLWGAQRFRRIFPERWGHAIAGAIVLFCGLSVTVLGL